MANTKKRCKFCKEYFTAADMIKVPAGMFCDYKHALQFANEKATKAAKIQHTAAKKKFYASDRGKQLKAAQTAFNAYIRWRDRDDRCISCGRNHSGQYHAGHYRSVGAAPHLRLNQFNVNKQCAPCNNHKSGNILEYRINLIKKFGVDKVEEIEAANEPMKLTLDDIESIRVYYVKLLKRCKEAV
jgi:hypothetical protein